MELIIFNHILNRIKLLKTHLLKGRNLDIRFN